MKTLEDYKNKAAQLLNKIQHDSAAKEKLSRAELEKTRAQGSQPSGLAAGHAHAQGSQPSGLVAEQQIASMAKDKEDMQWRMEDALVRLDRCRAELEDARKGQQGSGTDIWKEQYYQLVDKI